MKFKNWTLFLLNVLGLEDKCPTLPLSKEAYRNIPYTQTLIRFPLTSGLKLITYRINSSTRLIFLSITPQSSITLDLRDHDNFQLQIHSLSNYTRTHSQVNNSVTNTWVVLFLQVMDIFLHSLSVIFKFK